MRLYGYIDDDWAERLHHTFTDEKIANIEQYGLMNVTLPSKAMD